MTLDECVAIITKHRLSVTFRMGLKAVSKERPRFSTKSGRAYTSGNTREFEATVKTLTEEHFKAPWSTPVKVSVSLTEQVPKSWPVLWRTVALMGLVVPQRGDLDNKVKAITDAMNKVAYHDDSQIADIVASKRYGTSDLITVTVTQFGLSSTDLDWLKKLLKVRNVNNRSSPEMGQEGSASIPMQPNGQKPVDNQRPSGRIYRP